MPCTIYMTKEVLDSPSYTFKPLEGGKNEGDTFRYIEPIGRHIWPGGFFGGGAPAVWIDPPTKARLGGPHRRLFDIDRMWSLPLVSEAFRAVVESVEPGVHQFFPVDCVWRNGDFAARLYFLNLTVMLDAVDEAHTTLGRDPDTQDWLFTDPAERLVYSNARIGAHHIWVEQNIFRIVSGSDVMRDAFLRANLHGVKIESFRAV